MTTHRIRTGDLPTIQNIVATLAKRAAKLGVDQPTLTATPTVPFVRTVRGFDGEAERHPDGTVRTYLVDAVEITITSPVVRLSGWQFVARIEPADDNNLAAGNIVYALPGSDITPWAQWHTTPIFCDHCKANRNRKSSYVVAYADVAAATQIQVGSSCLADYLGHTEAEKLAAFLAAIAEFELSLGTMGDPDDDSDGPRGHGAETGWFLADVLKVAGAAIAGFGWVSARKAQDTMTTSTAQKVRSYLSRDKHVEEDLRPFFGLVTDDEVQAAIDWAASADVDTTYNEYLTNLAIIGRAGVVRVRSLGLAVSILASYRRSVERQVTDKAAAAGKVQGYVAPEGDKVTVTGTLTGLSHFDSEYGVRTRVAILSDTNHVVIWWASKGIYEPAVGAKVTLKGTVKMHDIYRDEYQTVLTRCKLEVA